MNVSAGGTLSAGGFNPQNSLISKNGYTDFQSSPKK
jgi:hypothetical protein